MRSVEGQTSNIHQTKISSSKFIKGASHQRPKACPLTPAGEQTVGPVSQITVGYSEASAI
eukprot:scaffold117198_cov34-Prasinocladus_malaysianus.AAC.1